MPLKILAAITQKIRAKLAIAARQPFRVQPAKLRCFFHALDGFAFTVRNEPNMRIHLAAAMTAFGLGIWLQMGVDEWRWIIAAPLLVLATELFNTALEQACNAITSEYRPEIKAAKDTAAAAVLICAISAALIGADIFLPKLLPSPGA